MINEASITDSAVGKSVKKALQDLMLLFPLCGLSYLGEAVELVEEAGLGTAATDGRRVSYDPVFFSKISRAEIVFALLHEWLHVFFNHPRRLGDRIPRLWNIAVDIVVNAEACSILKLNKPPIGIVPPAWAAGWSAEKIYDELAATAPENLPDVPEDLIYQPSSPIAEEEFRRKFVEELGYAGFVQEQMGISVPESVKARLEKLHRGHAPWEQLLRGNLLSSMGSSVASYARPNRKYYPKIVLPTMRSLKQKRLALLIDISASVGESLMGVFKSNIMPVALRAEETLIVTFDEVVHEVVRTKNPRTALSQIKFTTGAHSSTNAVEAFEIAERYNAKVIVCLTDGFVSLPKPRINTFFAIPETGNVPRWGKTYRMSVSW